MDVKNMAGVLVGNCRFRRNYRNYYFKAQADRGRAMTLIFMTRGKAHFEFDKVRFNAGPRDLVCYGPGELRESHPLPGPAMSYFLVSFEVMSAEGRKLSRRDLDIPLFFRARSSREISAVLGKLCAAVKVRSAARLSECSALGIRLLQTLAREILKADKIEADAGRRLHFRIRDTLEYIRRNYKKRLDVADLAKRACMHPAYFAHLFKREIGVPPHKYVLDYKIEKAKEFLCMFDEALDYTAVELGFHDYSHFYRVFKKAVGRTPMQFIKENKGIYDPR